MQILTVKEVAEMLKIKPSTVYGWAEQGIIPYFKIKGVLRFDESDILNWLKKFKKEPHLCYNPLTHAKGLGKRGMK